MKFATWNIACGAQGYYGKALANIAEQILREGIDVCALQEVDRFAKRSDWCDIPAYLQERTGLTAFFVPALTLEQERADLPAREYGNCILSRLPVAETRRYLLNVPEIPPDASRREREQRAAIAIKATYANSCVWFTAAHLAYSPDFCPSLVRRQQVVDLVAKLQDLAKDGAPLVFGGDLNTAADGNDIIALREFLDLQTKAIGPTWPLGGAMAEGREPFITLDHIMTRGMKLRHIENKPFPAWSDHSLVAAEFD